MNDDNQIQRALVDLGKSLPRFSDGRIDYTHSKKALVLCCFIEYLGKILLLRRSQKVGVHAGKWSVVTGFIDTFGVSLIQKVIQEVYEETGISDDNIKSIHQGDSYELHDNKARKIWCIYPVTVRLMRFPEIHLDWEHEDLLWIYPSEISLYKTVPNLVITLERAIKYI